MTSQPDTQQTSDVCQSVYLDLWESVCGSHGDDALGYDLDDGISSGLYVRARNPQVLNLTGVSDRQAHPRESGRINTDVNAGVREGVREIALLVLLQRIRTE